MIFYGVRFGLRIFMAKIDAMKISELCQEERPREKVLAYGPAHVSSAELLAILLRTGTKQESVLEIAQKVLADCAGSLTELSSRSTEQMAAVKGVGITKALTLTAAFELGRRMGEEKFRMKKEPVRGARDIYRMMGPKLKGVQREECWGIFLNSNQYVIATEQLTLGDDISTIIDSKGIVRRALDHQCRKFILVHNHPSGNPMPGKADISQTGQLKDALAPFNIKLLDHVIVSDDSFYSFVDDVMYAG